MLTEGVVVALASGSVGVILAGVAATAIHAVAPNNIPRLASVHLEANILGLAMLLSCLVGAGVSLVPAMWFARAQPITGMKQQTPGSIGRRVRKVLVIVEISTALIDSTHRPEELLSTYSGGPWV
jgi:hypothetical protein